MTLSLKPTNNGVNVDNLKLIELTDPEDMLARQAFDLYVVSFPVEERVSLSAIKEGILNRDDGLAGDYISRFIAAVQDDRTVGLSMYGYYRIPRLACLFYLAVQPDLRGLGLGAWLLNQTAALLPNDARILGGESPLGLCWEVDRPNESGDPEERTLRARRIKFYERNGAILLDSIDFIAPPLSEGLPPVPYFLMFMPLPDKEIPIEESLLLAVVDATLLNGYGVTQESPYYRRAISSIKLV
jgi:GNAT superfamily N-acetyltransferase